MGEAISNEEWAARIVGASPAQLVVISYEAIMHNIELAQKELVCGEGDKCSVHDNCDDHALGGHLDKAKGFLMELMSSLDLSYEMANELMNIYLFVNKLLISARLRHDKKPLEDALRILKSLHSGFCEAAEKTAGEPVIQNAEQIYAGLTYGKDSLNENIVSGSTRGFKA